MKLEIRFLNSYIIKKDDDHWLDFKIINSFKLAKLLAYIVYHHHRKLSSNDLQTIMFDKGKSNNPTNALKTLIYRLRTILKNNLGEADYILSSHGLYYWNPAIELVFDVDDFNTFYHLGRDGSRDNVTQARNYQLAFNLYKGDFLPMLSEVKELILIRTYLNSQYLNIARYLIEYYMGLKHYEAVEEICSTVLVFNCNDEIINLVLIESLVKQKKMALAKEHYNKVITVIKDKMSKETISKMKYYLSQNNIDSEEKNNLMIQNELVENTVEKAFKCDYQFFKKTYQLEARKASRKDNNKVVVLLTIKPKKYIEENLTIYHQVLEESSKDLEEIILTSLRLGDIVCKYSSRQFLMLLDCDLEGAKKALDRIIGMFAAYNKYERVELEYSFVEIVLANVHFDKDNFLKIE